MAIYWPTPGLKRRTFKLFLHNISAHEDASQYQVWLQNDRCFRGHRPNKHSLTFSTFAVTLTLNIAIQFPLAILRLMMMYHQTKLGCKRSSITEDTVESHILIAQTLIVTLTLKFAHQSFYITLRLIMVHHHTRFGCKKFGGSGDIVRTNIHWHFELSLWPWLWAHQSSFLTWHSSLWWCTIKQSLFVCLQKDQLFGRYITVIFWLCKPSLWLWPWS